MPQNHSIVLNYDAVSFGPQPKTVVAAPGDTLLFTLGTGAAPGQKIRITIHDSQYFTPAVVQHGPSQTGQDPLRVLISAGFTAKTNYACELLDMDGHPAKDAHGKPISVDGGSGGEIEPESGNQH